MDLSYGEIEDFLAKIHSVTPDKRTALKGRLKHFQRLGWPAGTNQGKGARVRYNPGQTLSLAVALEMLQLGMTPERVVEHLGIYGSYLAMGFVDVLISDRPLEEPVFFVFDPDALRLLRDQVEDAKRTGLRHLICRQSEMDDALSTTDIRNWRRMALISLTAILQDYVEMIRKKTAGGDPFSDVSVAISQWLSGEEVRRLKLKAAFEKGRKSNGDDT